MTPSDKLREIAERDLNKRIVGILMAHGVNSIDAFNSTPDLTALLEQHKEMMLREELIAYDRWLLQRKWMTGELISPTKAVDKYLEYLKNVKR